MLLFAVITVALAAPIVDHGWLPVVLGSRLASTASAVLLLGGVSRARASASPASASSARLDVLMEPSERLDRSTLALVAVAGVFDIVAFAVYAVGLEVAPTWLVGLASSFGPVIAVAYGVWRLGERRARRSGWASRCWAWASWCWRWRARRAPEFPLL